MSVLMDEVNPMSIHTFPECLADLTDVHCRGALGTGDVIYNTRRRTGKCASNGELRLVRSIDDIVVMMWGHHRQRYQLSGLLKRARNQEFLQIRWLAGG